ncbi:glutamyl-tRNA reductase [Frischella perrara]|uniref:Glutamyl-tRNA reductase n=1 Tax=Frischella perrara TaxID=1267021 RepID=A0A318MR09_FRIPE|nr:glutamyl-tRNA reductase [Frischella perrara]PXY95222.1 glutamyl-tRNA reductase [Frischella perrara]
MSIAILGINHKTASVSLRERVTFSPESIDKALYSLYQHPLVDGCVILSTCNRTEIYFSYQQASDLAHLQSSAEQWLSQFHNLDIQLFKANLYWYTDHHAVEHLIRVACGIDSMIIGEPQILGQVKQAYAYSHENQCLSVELTKLFQRVFHVAKRIRTETNIGSSSASVAYSACLIARQLFKNPAQLNVMLVGAGETIELIARYLKPHGFNHIIVANRTREKALNLANLLDAEIIALPDIAVRLKEVDIVISSTASPLPIIGKGMVERSMTLRKQLNSVNQKMLLIDLAVPRDIEGEISNMDDIYLYTIDDLQQIVQSNLEQRLIAAKEAELIIEEEANLFMQWLRSRNAVALIKQYRSQAEMIKAELTHKAINAIKEGGDIDEIMTKFSHQLTNRLIHAPTQSLLQAASQNCCNCLKVLSHGLGLKEH